MNLPPELSALIKELAQNVVRDSDGASPHEKNGDSPGNADANARMLETALAAMLGKGYRIVSPEGEAVESQQAPVASTPATVDELIPAEKELIERLRRKKLTLGEIRDMWDQRHTAGWRNIEDIYVLLAERLLGAGEPFFAHDVVTEGRRIDSGVRHKRLRQLQALALARSGAPRAGRALLAELMEAGNTDVETVSMLARTYKDMARVGKNEQERRAAMAEAQRYYQQAFDSSNEYYPAINAATCAVLLGRREEAAALAERVLQLCDEEQGRTGLNYWLAATRAEATLIRGDLPRAVNLYREAVDLARMDWGSLGSSRRQAETLLEHLGHDIKLLRDCFPPCRIAAFSGSHTLWQAGAGQSGTPLHAPSPEEEKEFRDRLCDYFTKLKVRVGFSAGTDWRDIVFLETILENEGEVHIVYPGPEPRHGLPPAQIWSHSIERNAEFEAWEKRWERLLHKATRISYVHQPDDPAMRVYDSYAYLVLQGLARLKCSVLSAEFIRPTGAELGIQPVVPVTGASTVESEVNAELKEATGPEASGNGNESDSSQVVLTAAALATQPAEDPKGQAWSHSLKALLFADIVGYSKLSDHDVGLFMKHYMGGVARMLEETGRNPEVKNTWGDAFYFAFSSVHEAGVLALDLADFMKQINAVELGLSARLRIRIGLHAGPVYRFVDPITGRLNYVGSHVSRAARIEPIAAEGQVYASESFAALAFADGNENKFGCEYVGEIVLPKNFGKQRIYLLSRG